MMKLMSLVVSHEILTPWSYAFERDWWLMGGGKESWLCLPEYIYGLNQAVHVPIGQPGDTANSYNGLR